MLKKTALLALYIVLPLFLITVIYTSNPGYYGASGLIPMVLGALAYTWLNLQLVLSARPKWLDSVFGLDRIMRFHGLAAVAAILLALVHKLIQDAVFPASIKTTLGDVAFYVFAGAAVLALIFIADTVTKRIGVLRRFKDSLKNSIGKYNWQVILHNVNFIAAAVIFVHVMLSYSASNPLVMAVYILYFGAAAFSYFYHKVISRYFIKRNFTIFETVKESPYVVTLKLRPEDGKAIAHKPGQFGFLRVLGDRAVTSEEHPFSISSAPGNETIDLTIKNSGDWTSKVQDIAPGAKARLDAPYGLFDPELYDCTGGAVFIAGGIGITPVLGILRHYAKNAPSYKAIIFWAVNKESELIRREEIESICDSIKGFKFVPVAAESSFAGETGYINEQLMRKYIEAEGLDYNKLRFFFCGPSPMRPKIYKALKSMGIKKKMIHSENFSL